MHQNNENTTQHPHGAQTPPNHSQFDDFDSSDYFTPEPAPNDAHTQPSQSSQDNGSTSPLSNSSVPLSASVVNPADLEQLPKIDYTKYNTLTPPPPPPSTRTLTLPTIKTILFTPRGEAYLKFPEAFPQEQTLLARYHRELATNTNEARPDHPPFPNKPSPLPPSDTYAAGVNPNSSVPLGASVVNLYNGHSPSQLLQRIARRLTREDWEHILEMITMRAHDLARRLPPNYQPTYPHFYELIPNPCRPKTPTPTQNPNDAEQDHPSDQESASTSSFFLPPSSLPEGGATVSVAQHKNQTPQNPKALQITNDSHNHNSLSTTGVPPVPPRQAHPPQTPPAPNPHDPENPSAPLQSVGLRPTPPSEIPPSPTTHTRSESFPNTGLKTEHGKPKTTTADLPRITPDAHIANSLPCPVLLHEMLNKVRDLLFPTRLENRKNGSGLCFSQLATNNIAKYLNNDHPHTWRSPELHEFLQTYSESVPAPKKPATPKKPKEPPAFLDLHETFAQWYDRCGNRLFVGDMEDHAYAFLLHARNLEDENPLSLLAHFPRDLDTYSITLTVNEKYQILHYTLNPDPNQNKEEGKSKNEEIPKKPQITNDSQNHNSLCTTGVSPVPPRQAYPLIAPPAPNPHNPENPIAPLQSVGQSPTPPPENTTTPNPKIPHKPNDTNSATPPSSFNLEPVSTHTTQQFPKLDSLPNVIDFISL